MRSPFGVLLALCLLAVAAGCASPREPSPDLLAVDEEQMKLRSMQTRTLDFPDRNAAVRGVIATLQDLGFIIERANEPLGLVTAARFAQMLRRSLLTPRDLRFLEKILQKLLRLQSPP